MVMIIIIVHDIVDIGHVGLLSSSLPCWLQLRKVVVGFGC